MSRQAKIRCGGRTWSFDSFEDSDGWYTSDHHEALNVWRVEHAPYPEGGVPVGRWAWGYRFAGEIQFDGFRTLLAAMIAATRHARNKAVSTQEERAASKGGE